MAKLNLDKYRKQQADLATKNFTGAWRPAAGKENVIRIFMFEHKVTKGDILAKLYSKDELGVTQKEVSRMGIFHYGLQDNPKVPSFSTPAIMEKFLEVNKKKDKASVAIAAKLRPNKKFFMNVIDLNDIEGGMKVYPAPKTVYDEVLKYLTDEDYGEDIFGAEGRDFKISYDDKAQAKEMYSVILRDEKKCAKLPSKLEADVQDLYDPKIFSNFGKTFTGDIEDVFDFSASEDEEEEEETDNEDEENGVKSSKSKEKDEEDEDLEDEEDEEKEDDEEDREDDFPFDKKKKKK